ncbi:serine hydrolase [Pasteurella atlantica]|uniref:Serine hydrolase n=2 Tax=Pasteurellaceae TaxID=712 RepID=A0ACC6HLA5_9PAST|nr:serine hydrolase [Pasteurella atlantica]MDP8033422.1 serine hydrolase [Pasteurella atlantica]MDP8035358.1 serine hydrolase [Pasteurella atlantica]MDP8037308.1 serine hydrolase [Pasteurella atlantica]MDP8047578.1 serine hydrolase [Pasteurella atlantica]MDP8049611.1 serine hydrolase [Pasteurella atlantica]
MSKIMNKLHQLGLCVLITSSVAYAQNDIDFTPSLPSLKAQTYVLMDYNSGQVLASLNPNQRHYPASLTKMMTSYVIGSAIKQGYISNDDEVIVSEAAWGYKFPGSSKMFLNLKQKVSVDELNRGIIIASGNDACVAMAEHISGSQEAFINVMNQYVDKFGLKNTHFATVHGLDHPKQYSSAYDMAMIASRIIRDLPEEYKIYSEKEFTFNKIKQRNRNGLLWDKSMNVDGMKTGHTNEAGYNLVASATNSNMRLISVVMGVPTYKGREIESKKLLKWGFNNFETFKSVTANQTIAEQSVYYGEQNKVKLGSFTDSYITIPKGKRAELKVRYDLENKELKAPLIKKQVVGKIIYQLAGKEIASTDLQVMEDVMETNIFGQAWDWCVLTVQGFFN